MRILKAFATAQVSSVIDFLTTVILSFLLGMYYVAATAIGAFVGGVSNCIFNYRWVFPASDSKKKYVAAKYCVVWVMSLVFNTYGTFALTELCKNTSWVIAILGTYHDQIYIVAKLVVSILVSIFWNYQMQRLFVYRNLNIIKNNSTR